MVNSIGYKGFLKVADEFSGTAAGNLANAYAGICYAQLGKYEDAVKYLDKFSAKDQLVSPAILGTIGNCYAEMGQLDKAAGTLLKAADKADSQALSPIYLIQAGQLFEKLGKNSEAVKAYTLVKENTSILTSQWTLISTSNVHPSNKKRIYLNDIKRLSAPVYR